MKRWDFGVLAHFRYKIQFKTWTLKIQWHWTLWQPVILDIVTSSDTGHCGIQWCWTSWHPVMLDIVASNDTGHCGNQWYWTLWQPVILDIVESLALPGWQISDLYLVPGHMDISRNANIDKITRKSLDFEVITHLSSMCRPAWCSSMFLCDCKSLKMLCDFVSGYDISGFIYLYGKRVNSWSKVCSKVEGLTPSLPLPGYQAPVPQPPHNNQVVNQMVRIA